MSLISTWLAFRDERSVSLSPTSLATDYRQVERWLERCPIQDLERGREVLRWVLQQQPAQSAHRVAGFVKALYRWAASPDVGLLPANPVASFRLPKRTRNPAEVVVIPRAQIPAVLGALREGSNADQRWDLVASFMLQTGLRTGEAFGLHWGDVDWAGLRCRIHQNHTLTHGLQPRTKTGRERWVPLNPTAQAVLRELGPQKPEGLLFPWCRHSFMAQFRSVMEQLHQKGVTQQRFRPYDLRHTAISRWLEAQIPVSQAAAWAGNTAEVIWRHYASATERYEIPVL